MIRNPRRIRNFPESPDPKLEEAVQAYCGLVLSKGDYILNWATRAQQEASGNNLSVHYYQHTIREMPLPATRIILSRGNRDSLSGNPDRLGVYLPYTDNQYLKDKAGNWRMLFFKLTYGGDEEVKFAVTPKHVVVFEDNDELSIDRERLERDLSEGNFGAGILSNEDYLDPGRLLPPNEDDLRLVSLTEELIFRLPFSAQQP